MIEIGAGLGTLTHRLAEVAGRVIAIERDRDLCALLRAELGARESIELCEANALSFDYGAVASRAGQPVALVGNLPYQIASQILFRLLDTPRAFSRIVVMLQKEMADRIVSPPGQGAYGALSVMLQMAAAGLGVAALPRWASEEFVRQGLLQARPLGGGIRRHMYGAVRAADRDQPCLQSLFERIRTRMAAQ